MRWLVPVLLLVGCGGPTEDVGARLRRECESIVRESRMEERGYVHEYAVQKCIESRGFSGR